MSEPRWTARDETVAVVQIVTPRIDLLRLRAPSAATLDALATMLGNRLPETPNQAVGNDPRAYCLAPGDWMVVRDDVHGAPAWSLPPEELAHVANVTDGRVVFTVSGAGAANLLASGTSLDLHPRVFPDGAMGQTLFAQIRVLVERVGADSFRLFADASLAAYLRRWFEDAIR